MQFLSQMLSDNLIGVPILDIYMYETHTEFPTQHWIIGSLLFMMQHILTYPQKKSGLAEKNKIELTKTQWIF